jgi:arylsulfatase A
MADAANIALPTGFITDGVSLMPQLLGKNYTPREWLFSHYDPKKGDFKSARFVHNKEWKLYETGEIYNVIKDPLEKNKLAEKDLNPEQQKLIAIFREVFKKMVRPEIAAKAVNKVKKKKGEDDDDL